MKSLKKVLLIGLLAFGLGFWFQKANGAGPYTVDLSTNPGNGTVQGYASGAFPNISGNLYVRKLVVSASTNTVNQTISIYTTCTSTTAATLAYKFYLNAVTAGPELNMVSQDFLPQRFKLANPCMNKSDTTSNVQATLFYE